MKSILLYLSLFTALTAYAQTPEGGLTRIAFGSCSDEDSTQIWDEVLKQKPQLWIWLGDNIYGDTHSPDVLRKKYEKQKSHPGYRQLMAQCPIIGTWDDHDYGQNDGGRYYPEKEESKKEMLKFLDVPSTDPVRQHTGVYSSHSYGTGTQKIKVILLDTRTFRDTLVRTAIKGRYGVNPDGDILGEEQWAWLENEFRNSDASVHLIGSSIQFISHEHPYEKWENFPKARQRMLALLTRYKIKHPLILSGDRHIAEISRMEVPGLPYALYDFTSSGLTHTWKVSKAKDSPEPNEKNEFRVGKLVIAKNFGIILIDWSGKTPVMTLEIRGRHSAPLDTPVIIR